MSKGMEREAREQPECRRKQKERKEEKSKGGSAIGDRSTKGQDQLDCN